MQVVAGIDLAGDPRRPTGLAVISGLKLSLRTVFSDTEICEAVNSVRLAAVDAPLTRSRRGYRCLDKCLIKLGFRVLPPSFPGMNRLTERGIRLRRRLEELGVRVFETHPLSCCKALGIGNREGFLEFMEKKGYKLAGELNRHTVDAAIAAYTAALHLAGLTIIIRAADGELVLPKPRVAVLGSRTFCGRR